MVLPEQTVAVAVIGVTGSGKSTFINIASGSNLPVGSYTSKLQSSTVCLDGQTVTLVDTPGFDGVRIGVLEVLRMISHFAGLQGVRLAGVIYMHCFTQDHMRGQSRHNFHVLRKFCGGTSLPDVLIVTNKQELATEEEFFGPAIDKGARILHHDGSQASARAILCHLLNREDKACPPPDKSHTTGAPATTLMGDQRVKGTVQEAVKNSFEMVGQVRYDLEQVVAEFATDSSRLEDENRRYKNDFTAQKTEAEFRMRLLEEERKARELAEARCAQAEAHLAEERAFWERLKVERESLREPAGLTYDKVFACGAVIFVLLCVSRLALHGSSLL